MRAESSLPGLAIAIAALTLTLTQATARADALATTYAGGNGQSGQMFDVTATRAVRITGVRLAFHHTPLSDAVKVYAKTGTHVGSETTPSDWPLLFSGTVTVTALKTVSPIVSLNFPMELNEGDTVAFYIQRPSGSYVAYTNGDGTGTVEATDSNIVILEGTGIQGKFGTPIADRIPNVTIVYDILKPFLRARGGKNRITNGRARLILRGSARSATSVEYRVVGRGGYKETKGSLTRWKAPVNHTSRRTVVRLRGKNAHGRTILRMVVKKP